MASLVVTSLIRRDNVALFTSISLIRERCDVASLIATSLIRKGMMLHHYSDIINSRVG